MTYLRGVWEHAPLDISECARSDMRPFSTKLKVKLPKIWASLAEVSLGKSQHVMHAYTS